MLKMRIRIQGHIDERWSEWFGGLAIDHSGLDETILAGLVPDQAALYGIIARLRDLGLRLVSLESEEMK